jgi:hypothetical protein
MRSLSRCAGRKCPGAGETRPQTERLLLRGQASMAGACSHASGHRRQVGGSNDEGVRREPDALLRFERTIKLPLRLVHITRNPYDVAARISLQRRRDGPQQTPMSRAIDYVAELAATCDELRRISTPAHRPARVSDRRPAIGAAPTVRVSRGRGRRELSRCLLGHRFPRTPVHTRTSRLVGGACRCSETDHRSLFVLRGL